MKTVIVIGLVFLGMGMIGAILLANHWRENEEYRNLGLVK